MEEKYKRALELAMRVAYNKGRKDETKGITIPLDDYIATKIKEIECLILGVK
jgi:hypothetical protein